MSEKTAKTEGAVLSPNATAMGGLAFAIGEHRTELDGIHQRMDSIGSVLLVLMAVWILLAVAVIALLIRSFW